MLSGQVLNATKVLYGHFIDSIFLCLLLFCAVNSIYIFNLYIFCPLIFVKYLFISLYVMQDSQADQPMANETFLLKIKIYLSIYLSNEM